MWSGGRYKNEKGYIMIHCPNHPRAKYNRPYIPEHILVVESFLGRFLNPEEVVHHINEIKDDNRISNLMVFPSQKEHMSFHNKIRQFGITRPILNQIQNRWKK